MLQLIVHADDFGLSEKINDGILQAYNCGILTSASIMANGAAFEHAVDRWRSAPSLDLGIHLTLVEETPVLDPGIVPSLVNEDGRFHRDATVFAKKYFMGEIRIGEVRRELEAQINKVISRGVHVSHLDSHQHVHILPQVLHTTLELAAEFGISAIRFPRERVMVGTVKNWSSFRRAMQIILIRFFCHLGRNAHTLHTDHFAGFLFGGKLCKTNLKYLLDHLPSAGTCELMCHPGLDDPHTRYSHWGYHWADELSALIDPEIVSGLEHQGIRLVSFRQLNS
jgi:hopanoid biosynthesis associated protein HpnK